MDEKIYVDSRKTSEVYARETQWGLLITPEVHPAQGVTYGRQLSAWRRPEESITCLACFIFPLYLTMTDVLPDFPLGSGISPTLTQLQSPPWEGGWERKEKKAGKNQIITENKWNKRRRPLLSGGNERLKLEKQWCPQLPEGEPHPKVQPENMTTHETERVRSHHQAPFSWSCGWSQCGKCREASRSFNQSIRQDGS